MEDNKIQIFTDGGSRGNPGPAAVGIVIESIQQVHGKIIVEWRKEYGEYIGETTNNDAEYRAVILALKKLKQLLGSEKCSLSEIEFYVDSELLAKQMNKEYKIKEKNLQSLFMEIWNLTMDFKKVGFNHVFREENKRADELVNQVLDREENKLGI